MNNTFNLCYYYNNIFYLLRFQSYIFETNDRKVIIKTSLDRL